MTSYGQQARLTRPPTRTDARTDALERRALDVLRAFNTWAFKREQPTEPVRLLATVAAAVDDQRPIPFILYWGKGPRADIASPDLTCLDLLAAMGDRIALAHPPGASFELCLTDTHARLNGHPEPTIATYFDAVTEAARKRRMGSVRLSRLVELAGPSAIASPCDESDDALLAALEPAAAKWYRGAREASEAARIYLAMNRVESRAVALHRPDAVFITFNGRRFRKLFPATLPVFYMYSLRRGMSVKPWFLDAHGRPYANAGDGIDP